MRGKILIVLVICLLSASVWGGFWVKKKIENRKAWEAKKQQAVNLKKEEITLKFTEGWSNKEIGEYLEKQSVISQKAFSNVLSTYQTPNNTVLPEIHSKGLQGFLYPDTYRFFKDITDRNVTSEAQAGKIIITKLLDTFFAKLPANADILARKNGLKLYDAIVLASIVEKETGRSALTPESKKLLEEERKVVAGIFYNRLKSNMPLQSDATINYVTGKNDPAPLLKDLEEKSPYNTYLHTGLPPTPICNPSLMSISAVLSPTQTDFYYFLHKQPSGEPVYSKTYNEHLQNKLKYLK